MSDRLHKNTREPVEKENPDNDQPSTSKPGNPVGRRRAQCDNLLFKQTVDWIWDHSIEKDCVKFRTKWKGYSIITKERAYLIAQKKGKNILREYLSPVNMADEFEWQRIIRKEPELANYMKEDERKSKRRRW